MPLSSLVDVHPAQPPFVDDSGHPVEPLEDPTLQASGIFAEVGSLLEGVVRQTGKLVEPIRKPVDDGVKWMTKPLTGSDRR